MQLFQRLRDHEFLGREFLLWLWFRSEINRGLFDIGREVQAILRLDGKMTLRSETESGVETITCSGDSPWMREARFALKEGKTVIQAMMKLQQGDKTWSFSLDSEWLNFKSLKTPGIAQDIAEDPEGLFYEKIYLIEQAVSIMDTLFAAFLKIRISPQWETDERPAMIRWIREG